MNGKQVKFSKLGKIFSIFVGKIEGRDVWILSID